MTALAAPPAESRLLGRDGERARIERLRCGRGQRWLVISGDPGIGKTALLRVAAEGDQRALWGTATGGEQRVPFGLLIDALEDRVLELGESNLRRLCAPVLAELALVFPALSAYAPPPGTWLQAERYRVHRALRRLLAELANLQPTALVLDDVQWADRESLEFLMHLHHHPVRSRLLVAMATRENANGALGAALRTSDRVEWLSLGPLSRDTIAALTGDAALYEQCGGNPFYARALLGSARRGPWIRRLESGTVPVAIVHAVATELDDLPDHADEVLQAAAILGDGFEPAAVAEVAGRSPALADAALDAAALTGVLAPDGLGRLRFRHPIVRAAVYDAILPATRRRLHARAAARQRAVGAPVGRWAYHLARSAERGDAAAIEALRDAAHAVRLTAPGTAAQWLKSALALLGDVPAATRLEILIPLATSLAASGELAESRRILHEILPLTRTGRVRGRIVTALAGVEHMLGNLAAATGLLERELEALGASDASAPEAAALTLQLGWDHLYANQLKAAAVRAHEACDRAERCGDPALIAAATSLRAVSESTLGRYAASAETFEVASALVAELSDETLAGHIEATLLLGFAAYHLDRLQAASEIVERGIAISRATERGQFYVPLLVLLGLVRIGQGDLASADALGRDAEDVALLATSAQWLAWARSLQCAAATLRGDLPRALRCGEEAVGAELTPHYFSLLARGHLASAYLESGDPGRCVTDLTALCENPSLPIERRLRPAPYEVLTRAELARGDVRAAARWAARADEVAHAFPIPARRGEALRSAAEVALARGDTARAGELARAALELTEPAGRTLDTARAWLITGRAGDDAALRRAEAMFATCGAQRFADAAAQQLRARGCRVARGGRPTGAAPNRLTARQSEIAELVTLGLTNREIGARLFLSEKTVEGHVAMVCRKLGVTRRTAIRSGLDA